MNESLEELQIEVLKQEFELNKIKIEN